MKKVIFLAKNLYSTQPSVSKVIKGLEDTLGMQLFERLPRGIRLTVQGHKMYEYASKIINEVNVLENMASSGMTKWIRISLNPSSWFANQFVDFYNETYEKKYHFQVTTAGVQSVMERVRDYMDDIGFVYILSQQKENFLYELSKNKMHFEPIYETDVMLYPGGLTELYNSGKVKRDDTTSSLCFFRFSLCFQLVETHRFFRFSFCFSTGRDAPLFSVLA